MRQQRSMFDVLREAVRSRDPETGVLCTSAFERAAFSWIGDGAGARRGTSSVLLIGLSHDDFGRTEHPPTRRERLQMLRAAVEATQQCIRTADILGRIDDETLGLLLPETGAGQAEAIANLISSVIDELPLARSLQISVSIGVAGGQLTDPWAAAFEALDDAQLGLGASVVVAAAASTRRRIA